MHFVNIITLYYLLQIRKMTKTYLLFVVILFASQMFGTDGRGGGSCYAPPFFWGSECRYVCFKEGLKRGLLYF